MLNLLLVLLILVAYFIVATTSNHKQLWHIILSTLTFSVICVAALHALLVAFQDWQLRHKQPGGIIRFLPPLETMETLLFQIIGLGFILLSAVLLTSLVAFYPLPSFLWGKIIESIGAWFVFAMLLLGRYFLGWRGQTAIKWTLLGFILLLIIYFGSNSF